MEAVPKSDIKSVIKSDIRFDISIKWTTWIGHNVENSNFCTRANLFLKTQKWVNLTF